MSRWIETCEDSYGRFYVEKLDDEKGCRHLINEVCCNADNKDMVADFPMEEDCTKERCPFFEAEPQDEIERLRKGIKTHVRDM